MNLPIKSPLPPRFDFWLFVLGAVSLMRGIVASRMQEAPLITAAWVLGGVTFFALAYLSRIARANASAQPPAPDPGRERLAAVGMATIGFAHEVRNSLTVLHGFVELARRAASDDGNPKKVREHLAEVDLQAAKLSEDIRRFLGLATTPPSVKRPVLAAFRDTTRLLSPVARSRELEFHEESPQEMDYPVREPGFRQALLNLGLNAIAYAQKGVRFSLSEEGGSPKITIEDDGPGVPPEAEPLLFTAQAPLRPGGTGLGLTQVAEAVVREGGTIHHERVEGGGARFVIRLPVRQTKEAAVAQGLSAVG